MKPLLTSETRAPKKRGPIKRLPPMVDTHIYLPADLLEFAKHHPDGLAGLVRRLLAHEYAQSTFPAVPSPPSPSAPPSPRRVLVGG